MLLASLLLLGSLLSDDPSPVLTAGDDAFLSMNYPKAIRIYDDVLARFPDDPNILWRLARAYVCESEVLEGDKRTAECKEAERYALRCIAADSTKAEGHCWRAAALGYLALDAGKSDQVKLSRELLREVNLALKFNPDDDAAYSIKGSFYRAVGNVSWFQRQLAAIFIGKVPDGGYEEAEVALKKAVALAPDVMRHQYELGILYIDMGRNDEAKTILERAATLPIKVAIDRPRLEKIHELLRELEGK
jgi:tetratricopeptide (TPR) repeat protein